MPHRILIRATSPGRVGYRPSRRGTAENTMHALRFIVPQEHGSSFPTPLHIFENVRSHQQSVQDGSLGLLPTQPDIIAFSKKGIVTRCYPGHAPLPDSYRCCYCAVPHTTSKRRHGGKFLRKVSQPIHIPHHTLSILDTSTKSGHDSKSVWTRQRHLKWTRCEVCANRTATLPSGRDAKSV